MSEKNSRTDIVYRYTESKIMYIESIADTGKGKAVLAKLRHGIGKEPGELPELWGIIFEKIPPELEGKNETSYAEWAIYNALTLYALHRQGSGKAPHCKEVSLGTAAAGLVKSEEDTERILNKLNLVATAVSPKDLAYHLRGIIQLLRSENIALDYSRLAKEIYMFNIPENAGTVKLKWGRDFYGHLHNKKG